MADWVEIKRRKTRPVDILFGPSGAARYKVDGNQLHVECRNGLTGKVSVLTIDAKNLSGLQKWLDGAYIQEALRGLNGSQREQLMSGMTNEDMRRL